MDNWMHSHTDIEDGQELESEIQEGYITEADLTETGRRCLQAYHASLVEGLDFLGLSDEPQFS